MKHFIKLFTLLLALCMLLSLAACNGGSNKEDDTTTEAPTTESPEPETPAPAQKVRVMTYNIWGMAASDYPIANRPELVSNVIHAYLPDVVGMQECSPDMRNAGLSQKLSDEYAEVNVASDAEKQGVINLYTPIFYRKSTVKLKAAGFRLFDKAYNNKDSKGVTYAVFQTLDGNRFNVFNTHYWHGSGNDGENARVANAEAILEIIRQSNLTGPIMIMGDMNGYTISPPFLKLKEGGFVPANECVEHGITLSTHHDYPVYDSAAQTYTGAPKPVKEFAKALDHIAISSAHSKAVEKFDVVTTDDALNSSDHCPVYIDLNFDLLADAGATAAAVGANTVVFAEPPKPYVI